MVSQALPSRSTGSAAVCSVQSMRPCHKWAYKCCVCDNRYPLVELAISWRQQLRLVKTCKPLSPCLAYPHKIKAALKRFECKLIYARLNFTPFPSPLTLKTNHSHLVFHYDSESRTQRSDSRGKWFSAEIRATASGDLPAPLSHLLSLKTHPKNSRGRKWPMRFLKHISIKKLMTDKGKSCRAFLKSPKFNLFPFSYLQAFHKWVQSLWLREKSSIVEIQIPPKSWELWECESVRYKTPYALGGRKTLWNVLFDVHEWKLYHPSE